MLNNPVIKWVSVHPRLSAWFVLSLGMLILLFIEARDVGLLFGQWVALIVATVLVAGLCVWIISWEDNDDSDEITKADSPAKTEASSSGTESA